LYIYKLYKIYKGTEKEKSFLITNIWDPIIFWLIYIKIKVNNKVGKPKLRELHKIKFYYLFGQLLLLWLILLQKEDNDGRYKPKTTT